MYEVIIIGAGFSGLAAAHRLITNEISDVVILEATDRLGGRVHNADHRGTPIELGARYFGDEHTALSAFIDRYGIQRISAVKSGDMIHHDGVTRTVISAAAVEAGGGRLDHVYEQLETMSARIDPTNPVADEDAATWDEITLADWLTEQGISHDEFVEMRGFCHGLLSSEPEEVSLLSFLLYAAGSGGLFHAVDYESGLLKHTADGTLTEVAERIVDETGIDIRYETRVTSIGDTDGGVTITTADNETITARHVIVAVPPAGAAKIALPDSIPAKQKAAFAEHRNGNCFACFAVFDRPFWRDMGLSGAATGLNWVSTLFDVTNPTYDVAILDCMVSPARSTDFAALDNAGRREVVLNDIRTYLDDPTITPNEIYIGNWHDQRPVAGAFGWKLGPGYITRHYASLRHQSTGRIFFAGTEQADMYAGYVEGAIRAGQRSADQVRRRHG
ncbi:MAG: NAD(P)/FAD-dependent oxidoreductase [Myxococcota bacterium]